MLVLSCPICTHLFEDSDTVHVIKCGHMFHNYCLEQWHSRRKTCPQCRVKCYKNQIFRVFLNSDSSFITIKREELKQFQQQLEIMAKFPQAQKNSKELMSSMLNVECDEKDELKVAHILLANETEKNTSLETELKIYKARLLELSEEYKKSLNKTIELENEVCLLRTELIKYETKENRFEKILQALKTDLFGQEMDSFFYF